MFSINTNLSSLIAQSSMKTSTNKLNQAIERMTTGFKINHASDNAANYSISTNMTTKINSYMVAEDNALQGLDMISTAEGTLSQIQDKLERLRALQEQASNGTYGEQSKQAINAEANALVDEIYKLYNSLEYNGIKLSEPLSIEDSGIGCDTSILPTIENAVATYSLCVATSSSFIKEVTRRDTSKMTTLDSVDVNTKITSGTYSISTAEELAKLATMANKGLIHGGEYVLANDIDLSAYLTGAGWTPIGANHWSENHFEGTFDGNGYAIHNLYINRPSAGNTPQGLFGTVSGTVKNVALVDADITGQIHVGGIVGATLDETYIDNCSVTGSISGASFIGGITGKDYLFAGNCGTSVTNCYSNVNISSSVSCYGGITGSSHHEGNYFANCIAEGSATGLGGGGGIVGHLYQGTVENSISYLDIVDTATGAGGVGGIAGVGGDSTQAYINNCYVYSSLQGTQGTGGIVGRANLKGVLITNSTFAGNVECPLNAGGMVGSTNSGTGGTTIESSIIAGTVEGTNYVGGVLGYDGNGNVSISNCYVQGKSEGLTSLYVGYGRSTSTVSDCYSSDYYQTLGIQNVGGSVVVDSVSTYNSNPQPLVVGLQIGIESAESSQIKLEAGVGLSGIRGLRNIGIVDKDYTETIDKILADVSAKQTYFGAVSNRLESVLDEISIQYDNLVSSHSTIRDADIAEVSATYIQQQILQQASATLLATANQSPAIALQLI